MEKEYVDKLKVLADLEETLFGNDSSCFRNRNEYHTALRRWGDEQRKLRILKMRDDTSLVVDTGREYYEQYIQLLKLTVGSSHEDLQRVLQLFSDGIDFHGMELDRYAVGSDHGYCHKLYLRSTPGEEILNLVPRGPEILDQIKVSWSPWGIWEAYLLYAAKDWIYLHWHANYAANDIVCQDTYQHVVPAPWMSMIGKSTIASPSLAEGYNIPYPSVRMTDDTALIHYVCHMQHSNKYVDRYVVVSRKGDSAHFDVCDEPNKKILNVSPVSHVCY